MSNPLAPEFEPAQKSEANKVPLKQFINNGSNGGIRRPTALHYAKTCVFYIIFYSVLVALLAICMWVFLQTIDPLTPKWQLEQSIIGTNPGLGLRPLPAYDQEESTLIQYNSSSMKELKIWTEPLDSFIAIYETPGLNPGRGQNIYNCDYNNHPPKGKVCDVDVKNWGLCTRENYFGFHNSAPCIFLKLNKIYGWMPEYYNTEDLPMNMPIDLKQHINYHNASSPLLRTVWVSCEGKNQADMENIGPISYMPRRGFPGYYYPYENSEGYLSPLVAVHLERPTPGVLINIECKAWARNIEHNRQDRLGLVQFKVQIN